MTDDVPTADRPCTCGLDDWLGGMNSPSPTTYSVFMDMCPKHAIRPVTSLPWSTADALHQTGYVAPSPYIYESMDLPPIGVRRGGIRFPRITMRYEVKRLGWRRWRTRVVIPGQSDAIFSFGPFTSRKKAEAAQVDLMLLFREVDYILTYKTGA